ncbi:MAG: YajQ family cyclic di-GMP-binding protein [Oligoflexia bacterium]|nr:YajQ family cyclic di-GMP-binding protein [Oligoflexia bacterium]
MPSFDIVSEVNKQEVDNAVNQAKKEVTTRFDFKNLPVEITLDKLEIKLMTTSEKIDALKEIVESKLIKRGVSAQVLDYQKPEEGSMGTKRIVAKLINGISKEKAKEINQAIKDLKLKVQPAIHDDRIRVTSKSIDELQTVIQSIKAKNLGIPLQFTNMRS